MKEKVKFRQKKKKTAENFKTQIEKKAKQLRFMSMAAVIGVKKKERT